MRSKLLKSITSKQMLVVSLMGFASGLPLLLVGSTLKAWLTEEGLDLKLIGFFSLVSIPYSFKFVWSPLMDYFNPKIKLLNSANWGRRKNWLLITQLLLAVVLLLLSFTQPKEQIQLVGLLVLLIAFLSASQDIVIDAYRREVLSANEQGLGSSMAVNAYRVALLFSGAFALYLADHLAWQKVYQVMAISMLVCTSWTFWADEPKQANKVSQNIFGAFIEPLKEFFSRPGAFLILAFIVFYKVGESMASDMTMPFYLKMGYTKTQIASVAKLFGFWATILGAFVGGAIMVRIGNRKSLIFFGILQSIALFGFSYLSQQELNLNILAGVITAENFSSGMATSALVAFMANQCQVRFSATQFALLSSLSSVPRVMAGSITGVLAEALGWNWYFIVCTLITIPGLFLILILPKEEPN